MSRSLDHEPLKKSPYHNQRQYSATLPRHSQRLDICAELLNYISELTQELMAETSFTEVSLLEEPNEINNTWLCTKQSSVAIQTEDIPSQNVHLRSGRSVGTQVNKRMTTEPDNDKQARIHLEKQSPSKPFKIIKKMLKEGSIEGIEDDPPVFKPPPPPPTAYVAAQVNVLPKSNVELQKQPPITRPVSSKVAKCLSTFEPSNDNKLNDQMSFSEIQRPFKSPTATKSPKVTVTAPLMSSSAFKSPTISTMASPHRNMKDNCKMRKQTRSLAFTTKAETVDHCFTQRLSPAVSEKQIQISNTPPPPPIGKEPPPKIVVEVPPKKHRQSSSCGTTCSCLCLKVGCLFVIPQHQLQLFYLSKYSVTFSRVPVQHVPFKPHYDAGNITVLL